MQNFPFLSAQQAKTLLRVAIALIMVAHGIARIYLGTVGDFGGFLAGKGFPAGVPIAWLLTVVEIAGGLTLAAGYIVPWLCAWFVVQHLFGIMLVHAPNGWFTVGAQSGGMEYSCLLIVCFLVTVALHRKAAELR